MKIDMVKPMPASSPTRTMLRQLTSAGSTHQPRRTISQLTLTMPNGFPATRATATAIMTHWGPSTDRSTPERLTPALAKANTGMMPKATQGCRVPCMRTTGGSSSRWARRSRFNGSMRSLASCSGALARPSNSPVKRVMASSGRSRIGIAVTGVIRPSTTPARVGWAPVNKMPSQTIAPGRT
ncbi:hypothetical protein D3C80_918290 [compost metagenome]